ncbi:uncharacterized protein PITG_19820 [Phytophthora infestans T30-4]|uniref:Uncharacterized protein n=1 Tax=Phytophthora infestans (strain T30-4) TaxID=403677 RepID=D0P1K6_PHYIT|nr:uncharacterized protein PITG_19820 [Phytophthora infestans T30-4]EEY54633.1 conserved hypothetical protein [Phytophthora infestans T30-4]|eukprot:XP_002895819.1 conserved hypothetical protein [Phytophthora infestans T30-4]
MKSEDTEAMLVVAEAIDRERQELHEVRREVFGLLIEEAWRAAMRSRHYLTGSSFSHLQLTGSKSTWTAAKVP